MPETRTDESIPPEKVRQYRTAKAIYMQATTPGEAKAAENAMARLRLKYPGVDAAADREERAEQRQQRGGFSGSVPTASPGGFWDAFNKSFRVMSAVLEEITNGLDAAVDAQDLCDRLDEATQVTIKDAIVRGDPVLRVVIDVDAATMHDVLEARRGDPQLTKVIVEHLGKLAAREGFRPVADAFDEDVDDPDTEEDDES